MNRLLQSEQPDGRDWGCCWLLLIATGEELTDLSQSRRTPVPIAGAHVHHTEAISRTWPTIILRYDDAAHLSRVGSLLCRVPTLSTTVPIGLPHQWIHKVFETTHRRLRGVRPVWSAAARLALHRTLKPKPNGRSAPPRDCETLALLQTYLLLGSSSNLLVSYIYYPLAVRCEMTCACSSGIVDDYYSWSL